MKYHLITFGCQMNKNDSERIAEVLESVGYESSEDERSADLVVVNTCSVRQSAEDRVFGQVRQLLKYKAERPNMVIAVTGCMPGRDHDDELRSKLSGADLFFPIADLPKLPAMLKNYSGILENSRIEEGTQGGETTQPTIHRTADYLATTPKRTTPWFHAYVTISTGCSNFCTSCVVPFSRGLQQNRPMADVLGEIRTATEHGAKQITLLGQNVDTYNPPDLEAILTSKLSFEAKLRNNPFKSGFAALLWEINQIPGVKRIHFTAPNPQDMNEQAIAALALPKHMNYLHLPVQAGSNRVLKKMNRRYTRERYLEIIEKVKEVRPGIAIGTDIIVGFCSETEAEFEETLDLYRQVEFDISYHAMYSARTGTLSHRLWRDDVPREEKQRRWQKIQKLMEETTLQKNQSYIGKTVEVLVERCENNPPHISPDPSGRATVNRCLGLSREMKLVEFPGDASLVGQTVHVRITEAQTWILKGHIDLRLLSR